MNLKDPGTLLLAWVVAPVLVALACTSIGAGIGVLASLRLGALTAPTGFFTGIVVMVAALRLGATGVGVAVVVVALSLIGAVLAIARGAWRPSGDALFAAAAATATYLLTLAPLVGSGRAGILGYVLNNDPSVHVSVIEYLRAHGTDVLAHPTSSFESAASVVSAGYPLGGHVWGLFASVVTGRDAFYVWQPVLSVAAAMLALAAYGVLRELELGRLAAALAGVLVAVGYLPYSFVAEGGFKEVVVGGSLLAFAALFGRAAAQGLSVRRVVPTLIVAAGAIATFSMAAAAWFAPGIAVVAVWLLLAFRRRRGRRVVRRPRLGIALAVLAAALAAPVVVNAAAYLRDQHTIFARADQVGNLLAPVPFWEAFNIWLGQDYRYPTPLQPTPTTIGVAIAAVVAIVGVVVVVVRRRASGIALFGAALGTALVVAASASIYYKLKAYVVVAPSLAIATVLGLGFMWNIAGRLRGLVALVSAALAVGVLASAAMVYAGVWVTPKDRLVALIDAGRHIRRGPVLVNDREYYAKYFLRDRKPWNSWDEWQPFRGFQWGEIPPPPPRAPDMDDYRPDLIQTFPALIDRRRPGGSRPPGNFAEVYANRFYTVWRRVGRAPRVHLSLGIDTLSGAAAFNCSDPSARSLLARARHGEKVRYQPAVDAPVVANSFGWGKTQVLDYGPAKDFLKQRGGFGYVYAPLRAGHRYSAWIQGAFGPGVRLSLGNQQIGEVRSDEEQFSGWHEFGTVVTRRRRGATFAVVGLTRPWYLAGSAWNDITGPIAFQLDRPRPQPRTLSGRNARRLCGRMLDWIELI